MPGKTTWVLTIVTIKTDDQPGRQVLEEVHGDWDRIQSFLEQSAKVYDFADGAYTIKVRPYDPKKDDSWHIEAEAPEHIEEPYDLGGMDRFC